MKLKKSVRLDTLIKILFIIYLPVTIVLALFFSISLIYDISMGIFTRDSAVIAQGNLISLVEPNTVRYVVPFIGIISNLGILLWTVSAFTCFFGFAIITYLKKSLQNEYSLFLVFFGFVSLFLLLDDLLLFHELIAPSLFIPEVIVYVLYGMIVSFAIVRFQKVILQTEWIILCLALIFFFLSMALDYLSIFEDRATLNFFLEDGFKLFGIASWVSYFVIVSFRIATSCLDSKSKTRSTLSTRNF